MANKQSQIRENDLVIRPIPAQAGFLMSRARYPAFVGAWGTGKSMTGIGKAVALSEGHPENLGMVFRKEFTDLKDSTIKDFEKYTGMAVGSSRDVKFPNGSMIMFRHLEELNNIQNVNLGWFWIEQAEEIDTDEPFFTLFGRLRRKGVPHQGFITANTKGHNWIYRLWKSGDLDGGELFEAKTADNAHNLPPEFIESLEILKTKKPKIYARFVESSWDDADTVDQIILPEWVRKCAPKEWEPRPPHRRAVSIDVGRFGDDRTAFYALEGGAGDEVNVLGKEVHQKRNTMEVVGLALRFAKRHKDISSFAVDEIGVGGGVVDRLKELGKQVIPVNSSKRSARPDDFYNVRAEFYSRGADLMEAGKVSLMGDDDDLKEELTWARYKVVKSNGAYQVESKDDIKKRYGRSPDLADSFLMGLWALPMAEMTTKEDRYLRAQKRRLGGESGGFSPMAV